MKINTKSKPIRIVVGISVPLIAVVAALFLYFIGQGPGCSFFRLTGILCPGCGAGRATVALLHLDILGALDYNAFYVIMLPFLIYYMLKLYISYVFGKDILPFFNVKVWMAVVLLVLIIAFWVLRNIPLYPFAYLAP